MTIQVFLRYIWLYILAVLPLTTIMANPSTLLSALSAAVEQESYLLFSPFCSHSVALRHDGDVRASPIERKLLKSQALNKQQRFRVWQWAGCAARLRMNVWQSNIQLLLCCFRGTLFIITQLTNLPLLAYPGLSMWYRKGLNKNRIKNLFTRATCITQTCGLCIISWLSRMS